MAAFPPPTPNEIFNTADFAAETGVLTVDTLKNYFLTYPIGQGTETIPALIVQGATNLQEDVSVGGDIYLTDTVGDGNNIYFQTADVTQASISVGTAGDMTLTTVGDMTFATNESGVYPLVLGTDNITMQSNEIVINASDQITIDGGTIDINSGVQGINILGAIIEIESVEVSIGVDTTTSISMGNGISTFALTSTTIDLTSSGQMTLASDSDMVLQALNGTNTAYIELDTTFIRTLNTLEIDLTASGVIELTTASNMTLTASGDTTITGSTITLDAPQDEVLLATEPSGTVDLAVASVGYVNSGYIPIGQGMPVATVIMWAGDWANLPTGFMLCNGQSVSQATYSALYAVVGNYYGVAVAGNFLLPNLVNTFPIGSASGGATTYPYSTILGSALSNGGSSTISLNQIPSHAHGIIGNNTGTGGGSSVVINPSGTAGTATQSAGGGQAYAPPFQALQFLIKF